MRPERQRQRFNLDDFQISGPRWNGTPSQVQTPADMPRPGMWQPSERVRTWCRWGAAVCQSAVVIVAMFGIGLLVAGETAAAAVAVGAVAVGILLVGLCLHAVAGRGEA